MLLPPGAPPTVEKSADCPLPHLRPLGQFAATYLLAEGQESLYLIDQHAAHERWRYERLLQQGRDIASQPLLTPLLINFSPLEMGLLEENQETLATLGFAVEPFGAGTARVREVPHDLAAGAVDRSLREFLADLQEGGGTLGRVERLEWLRKSVACQGAIKAGQYLELIEIQRLLRDWAGVSRPQTCPHGRPVFQVWPLAEIHKRFWR